MKARALSRLWQSLESIPGLLEVPAAWEATCGPDFAWLRPHLRVTDTEGALYPCPRAPRVHCPRKIVDLGDGEYIAICRDPLRVCEDVPLAASDVLLHAVDLGSMSRILATPLGVRWQPPELSGDSTWGIGLSERRDSRGQPVFLIVLPDTARFVTAVQRLTRIGSGPFVLAAPTNRHHTIEAQELLHSRGATFLPLEEHLLVNEAGELVPANVQDTAKTTPITPCEDRRRVVKEFVRRNECKIKHIQEAAGVHESDYYGWLKGEDPDRYAHCISIEEILHYGFPPHFASKLS